MEELRFARRNAPLAWGILVVFGMYFLCGPVLRPLVRPYAYSDFATFYDASRCFAGGLDAYDSANLRAARDPSWQGWVGQYFYPPPFAAVAVRPLAALPFEIARRIWVLLEATAFAIALVGFARLVGPPWPEPWPAAIAAGLGAAFAPLALDLKLGSVTGFLLLLLLLFERARARGQLRRAALALAAAVLLKLTPALLVAFLLVRRERRLVGWTVAWGVALVVVCLPWTGWRAYVTYVQEVLPHLATASFAWFTNQSLDALFWRLFVPNPDTTPWLASPALYRVLVTAAGIAIAGALVWLASRPATRSEPRWWDDCTVLVASLLLARVTWEYMVILALPCFLLWMRRFVAGEIGRGTTVVVAAAYALCALPFPYTEAPIRHGPGLLFESPRTAGLLLLFAASLAARRGSKAPAPPAAIT